MRSGLSFYGTERPSLLLGSEKILGIHGDLLASRSLRSIQSFAWTAARSTISSAKD
jgi:hypothetical protein